MQASHEQRRRFAAAYLRTMSPHRAALAAGLQDGAEALGDKSVEKLLEKMREEWNGQIRREDAIRRLCELAFGRANDAVKLALQPGRDPSGLDLAAVSELKTKPDGTVEVKFIDRVKALEVLCHLLSENGDGAVELFRALAEAGEELP